MFKSQIITDLYLYFHKLNLIKKNQKNQKFYANFFQLERFNNLFKCALKYQLHP